MNKQEYENLKELDKAVLKSKTVPGLFLFLCKNCKEYYFMWSGYYFLYTGRCPKTIEDIYKIVAFNDIISKEDANYVLDFVNSIVVGDENKTIYEFMEYLKELFEPSKYYDMNKKDYLNLPILNEEKIYSISIKDYITIQNRKHISYPVFKWKNKYIKLYNYLTINSIERQILFGDTLSKEEIKTLIILLKSKTQTNKSVLRQAFIFWNNCSQGN